MVRSCGRFWRVSASTVGPSIRLSASSQHSVDLDGVAGPEHAHVGNGAQRREMLDRLMRRAVFAEPDRIMGHHVDDAGAHQRGEPHRRPRIVGEDQEGRAVRREAAMQEDAVHGRGHAVLADAVMDEAALRRLGRERHRRFRLVVVGAGEVGGAGEEFHRHRRRDRLDRGFGGFAGGDILRRFQQRLLVGAERLRQRGRPLVPHPPLELGALAGAELRRSAPSHSLRAAAPRLPAARQAFRTSSGTENGFQRNAELFLGALEFVGAERLAMGLRRAGPGRRAVADGGLAGDQRRLVGFLRAGDRRRNRLRIMAVDQFGGPAGGLEALHLVDRIGDRGRAVDRDAVVVVQHDQLVELPVAGHARSLPATRLPSGRRRRRAHRCGGRPPSCRIRRPASFPPAPCRPRWRCPGRAGRWWSRCPWCGSSRDGQASSEPS